VSAASLALTSYGIALGFRCAEAIRIEAALYRLRRIDRLIIEGKTREARRTFAAVEREFALHRGAPHSGHEKGRLCGRP
jgi:hypothetical protein